MWIAILATVVMLLPPLQTAHAGSVADQTKIHANETTSTSTFRDPHTDGEYALWHDLTRSNSIRCSNVEAVRLGDREDVIQLGRVHNGAVAAIDDGKAILGSHEVSGCVAGQSNGIPGGVRLIDLETGAVTPITGAAVQAVDIDGDVIAWLENDFVNPAIEPDVRSLWVQDLATDEPATEIERYEIEDGGVQLLHVDGQRVFWVRWFGANTIDTFGQGDLVEVMAAQAGQVPDLIASFDGGLAELAIAGELIVTITDDRPQLHDLSSGESRWLSDNSASDIATDGRYVFWTEGEDRRVQLIGYDWLTNSRFILWDARSDSDADDAGTVRDIDIQDGTLVWVHGGYNTWMSSTHAARLANHLPSARRVDPGTTNPNWTYYSESGHYLANDFRNYWENNGGLSVFGYPLTEEFDYLSPETGSAHAAQMTERQRFEWHPENAGTPYAVLLGRLGEAILEAQGRDWTTFEKADPSADHYFEATGHAIAPEFYDYWASHGLDLGYGGVSFEESVALFGYPLSESMLETNADGDTVLTQYFERAVFEYHPDNPASSQVLLRRLGAELMESWGW